MKLSQLEKVTCWGLTKSIKSFILKPKNFDEVKQCIEIAEKNDLQISIRGGGNSYTDVFMNTNQIMIDTSNLTSIKKFDVHKGEITVEAGIQIGELLKKIMPNNWSLVALSGSANDRIGGMMSSNTHGKDTWSEGNFSQNIISFKIMISDGTIEEINKNSEIFNAVIGGLGFFGIILEVTMKLKQIESFMVKTKNTKIHNFEELFEKIYLIDKEETNFSYGLVDPFSKGNSMGRGQIESSKYVERKNCSINEFEKFLTPKSKIGPLSPESFWKLLRIIWGNKTQKILNHIMYHKSSISNKKSVIPYPNYQYMLSSTPKLNLLFAPNGFLELQNIFPKNKSVEAFIELISVSQEFNLHPFICGVKRHKKDPSFLAFANDGLSITMNFSLNKIKKKDKEKYCDKLIEIILDFKGKIYISKHAYLPKWAFQKMYPDYTKLLQIKNKIDPKNIFTSDATKRLLLE